MHYKSIQKNLIKPCCSKLFLLTFLINCLVNCQKNWILQYHIAYCSFISIFLTLFLLCTKFCIFVKIKVNCYMFFQNCRSIVCCVLYRFASRLRSTEGTRFLMLSTFLFFPGRQSTLSQLRPNEKQSYSIWVFFSHSCSSRVNLAKLVWPEKLWTRHFYYSLFIYPMNLLYFTYENAQRNQ